MWIATSQVSDSFSGTLLGMCSSTDRDQFCLWESISLMEINFACLTCHQFYLNFTQKTFLLIVSKFVVRRVVFNFVEGIFQQYFLLQFYLFVYSFIINFQIIRFCYFIELSKIWKKLTYNFKRNINVVFLYMHTYIHIHPYHPYIYIYIYMNIEYIYIDIDIQIYRYR